MSYMAFQRCRSAAAAAALFLALLSLSAVISLASQVPSFDPEKWNKAFTITITNVTEQQASRLTYNFRETYCSTDFDSQASRAALYDCFYKKEVDGTYSFWKKYPGDWRDDSNCYCYAVNTYKGGFCVPGAANGTDEVVSDSSTIITCELMRAAVVADGAKQVSRDEALTRQPSRGHYIAIMVRNDSCNPYHCWGNDFHAVRQDSSGLWSWKEPGGPVGDYDLFGNKIKDPETNQTAIINGHYNQFCGYFNVFPDTMTIGGNFNHETLKDTVMYYEQSYPGAKVTLQESTPYNATVDGLYDGSEQRLIDQDLRWESKRGSQEWMDFYQKQWARDAAKKGEGSESSGPLSGSSSGGGGATSAIGRKMLRNVAGR